MTEEAKTDVDDMKDFAQQAKLEVKQRGRDAKRAGKFKAQEWAGEAPSATQRLTETAGDKMANAEDFGKQVGLEARMRGRDAKLAFDKSDTGKSLENAKDAASDAAFDAKHGLLDALQPATKAVKATSTRGVPIDSVENAKNERLEEQRQDQLKRQAREQEKAKEAERQHLVDSVKEHTEGAKLALEHAANKAEVAVGKAVVATKEKIDELGDKIEGKPQVAVSSKTSERGIDISSAQNTRNEELRAQEEREQAVAKAHEKTVGEKIADAGARVKEAVTSITTDAPPPIYMPKRSSKGVDISSIQNAENAALAAKEREKLDKERAAALEREKEVLKDRMSKESAGGAAASSASATSAEPRPGVSKDDLSAKFSQLGQSISRAAGRLTRSLQSKYRELAHPVPLDVHEKKSDNGIDTTSIQNAHNNALGEQYKVQKQGAQQGKKDESELRKSDLSASSLAPAPGSLGAASSSNLAPVRAEQRAKEDGETAAIKQGLDSGVAVQHAAAGAKQEAKQGTQGVKQGAQNVAAKVGEKIEKAEDKVAEKLVQATAAPTAL